MPPGPAGEDDATQAAAAAQMPGSAPDAAPEAAIGAAPAGRVVWLELNAQRAAAATGFYRDLFGWEIRPMAVAPWGVLPVFAVEGRALGLAFSAMGAFAPPRWLPEISGDPDHALAVAPGLGGVSVGVSTLPGHGRTATLRDPAGALFKVIAPDGPPPPSAPGRPWGAGYWGQGAARLAGFYAAVLGFEAGEVSAAGEVGARSGPWGRTTTLGPPGGARLFLHDVDYEVAPPRWVPLFESVSPGGDGRRAEILGAVVQVPVQDVPGLGVTGVWSDPAGAAFALCQPEGGAS